MNGTKLVSLKVQSEMFTIGLSSLNQSYFSLANHVLTHINASNIYTQIFTYTWNTKIQLEHMLNKNNLRCYTEKMHLKIIFKVIRNKSNRIIDTVS